MHEMLETWERFSADQERPFPEHRKTTAAPSTPAARLLEVEAQLELGRQYLALACAEIRRLDPTVPS